MADEDPPRVTAYDDLPAVRVTASQLVAWNLARFRQAAAMQQDELGARVGWSGKKVSALETSWKGDKTRQFEASAIVALAAALRVPVSAFLLPPDDDGVTCRYVLAGPGGGEDLSMAELVTYLISDPAEDDSPAMRYYRERYAAALGAYLDPARVHEIAGTFDDYAAEEHVTARMAKLAGIYDALREMLLDIDGQQDALARRLEKLRGQ